MPKNDPNLWMWRRAWNLLDRADRMNRGFARSETSATEPSVWQPPVDVYRSESALWILVALPGVSADTVSLTIEGAELVIAGVRKRPDEIVPAEVLRIEIPHGRFERRIALPPGTHELRTRRMVDGCLVLEVILG